MAAVLRHIQRNAVAYLALFVALGGTSYAATQIGNHSLTPVKLNPRYLGGYVREWASVSANGHVTKSTDRPKVEPQSELPADYFIFWPTKPTSGCIVQANVVVGANGPTPGYAVTQTARPTGRDEESVVQTYNSLGQETPLPFNVSLLCSTPR